MSYFNIQIDNDITYLLKEMGHNVKVNNVPAKAIINNSSMERTFDDKKIITHEELKRGYYINYNDLYFLLLNEVNDKRYLSYYKGVMRRCNFDIKFIVGDRLYLFPSIIEGDKFFISDNNLLPLNADAISVTLPLTEITKQLKKLDCFIKWGQKWEIQGLDYTKNGLTILNCKTTETGINDDKENEIADRYKQDGTNKVDILNGNITPILPFNEEPTEPEEPEESEPPTENISYTVIGQTQYAGDPDNEISINSWCKYVVKKFIDDVEVEGNFTFELDSTKATLSDITNNSCKVNVGNIYGTSIAKLIATDVETGMIAIEKSINIKGR